MGGGTMSSIIKDECICATGSDDNATLKQYLLERKELMLLYKSILEYMKIMPTEETLEVGKVKENSIYFKLLTNTEKTIEYVNDFLIHFPRKERVLKERMESAMYDIIECIYSYKINKKTKYYMQILS